MNSSEIHSAFVKRFSQLGKEPLAPVSLSNLSAIEKKVGTIFPRSFVAFITTHGPVFCPQVLDLVVDARETGSADFEGWDVAEFLKPTEIPKIYAMYASGGMDSSVIPFAGDSCGNLFGFRRNSSASRPVDAAVIFFDHDFCKVSTEAESFDGWLERFLLLPPK